MKSFAVCVLLLSVYRTQGQIYGGNGRSSLDETVHRMTSNLNRNIMNMNHQYQNDFNRFRNELRYDDHRTVVSASELGPPIDTNVPGNAIIVRSPRSPKVVVTLHGADGQTYYHDGEDQVIGSILYHTDRVRSPSRGTVKEIRYTLDLSNPNARPVPQTN